MSNVDINNLIPTTVPQEEVDTYLADVEQRLKQQQAEFNKPQQNNDVSRGDISATVKPFKVGSYAENVQQHLARNSALRKARLVETTEQVRFKLDPESYTSEMIKDFDANPSMTKADFYTKYAAAPSYAKDRAWSTIQQYENQASMERALRAANAASDRTVGQVAEDTARSVGAGALQTANVAVGLVELAAGETELGKTLTTGAESLKSGYSDKTKAQQQITQEEFAKTNAEIADKQLQEGRSHTSTWWEVLGDSLEKAPEAFATLADNPTALTAMALESGLSATLPAIAAKAAKAAVKGASKEVIERVGTGAAVAAIGATEGVSAAQEARQQVDQMSYDQLAEVSPLYNELIASNKTPEEAKLAVKENVFRSTAVLAGLSAAAISKVSGVGKLESELLDGVSGVLGKANKFMKNVTGQFLEEGTQEAVANVIGESVIRDVADVTQKVGGELATDFAAGAAAGALTAGAVSGTVETLGALSAGGQKVAKSAEGVQQVKAIKQAIDTGDLESVKQLKGETADDTEKLMYRMYSQHVRSTEGMNTPEGIQVFQDTFERLSDDFYNQVVQESKDKQVDELYSANPNLDDEGKKALASSPEFLQGVRAKMIAKLQSPQVLAIQERYSKDTENESEGLKKLLGAFSPNTDTDTATVDKTIRVLGSSPDKASLDQLKAVQTSKAYATMTPNQKTVVDSLVAFKSVSNAQEVSDFIRTGGKDKANVSWKGAANYMQAFSNALKIGNLPVATAQIDYLRDVFIPSQEAKYLDYQTRQEAMPTPARARAMELMQKDTAVLQNTLNYMTAFMGSQQDVVDASIQAPVEAASTQPLVAAEAVATPQPITPPEALVVPEAEVAPQPAIPLETPTEGVVATEVPAPAIRNIKLKGGTEASLETEPAPKAFSSLVRMENGEPKAIIAKNSSGEEIGRLIYMPNGGPIDVFVKEEYRRKGVGTELYNELERQGGKIPEANSGVAISTDASAFRLNRKSNVTTSTEVEGAVVEPKTDGNVPIKSEAIKAKLEAPIEVTPEEVKAQYTTKVNEAISGRKEQKTIARNREDLDNSISEIYDQAIAKGMSSDTVTNMVTAALSGRKVTKLETLINDLKNEISDLENQAESVQTEMAETVGTTAKAKLEAENKNLFKQYATKAKKLKQAVYKLKVYEAAKKAIISAAKTVTAGDILFGSALLVEKAKELFTPVKTKGVLATNPDLFNGSIESIAAETGLTDEQASLIKSASDVFGKEFNKLLKDVNSPHKNPFSTLYGTDGNKAAIDQRALDVVFTAALSWFIGSYEIHRYSLDEDTVKASLGLKPHEHLDQDIINTLRYIGVKKSFVMERLPTSVYKALGLKADKNLPAQMEAKIKESLGTLILETFSNMGVLRISTHAAPDSNSGIPKKTLYVKSVRNKNGLQGRAKKLMDAFKGSEDILGNMIGEVVQKSVPSFDKPTTADIRSNIAASRRLIKGQKIPASVVNGLLKHAQEEQIIFPDMLDKWKLLDETSKLRLAGYVDLNDLSVVHVTERGSIEANNESLKEEVKALDSWIDEVELNGGKPFYFNHEMWSVDRFGLSNPTINPQANKLTRRLLGSARNLVTINSAKDTDALITFKYAVAGSILGYKITERVESDVLAAFDSLMTNEKVQIAVAELNAADAEGRAFDVDKILPVMKEGTIGFQAVVAYQAYQNAVQTGSDFTTTLPIEIDGKTNGTAFSTLQFAGGTDVEAMKAAMERAGVFTYDTSYADYRKNPLNLDHYQNLAVKFATNLYSNNRKMETNPFVNAILGQLLDVDPETGNVTPTSLGRAMAKPPTMVGNYGAALNGMLNTMADEVIKNMYADIVKAWKVNKHSGKTSDATIVARAEQVIYSLNRLVPTANFRMDVNLADQQLTKAQRIELFEAIKAGTKKSLSDALKSTYGAMNNNRTFVQEGIHYAFKQFQTVYHKAYLAKVEDLRKTNPNIFALNSNESQEVFDSVAAALPVVSSYLRRGHANGMPMVKEQKIPPVDLYWRMKTTAKLYNEDHPDGIDLDITAQEWESVESYNRITKKKSHAVKLTFKNTPVGLVVIDFNGEMYETAIDWLDDGTKTDTFTLTSELYSADVLSFMADSVANVEYPGELGKNIVSETGLVKTVKSRSFQTLPEVEDLVNNGVAGPVTLIQSLDAGTMFELFTQMAGLNVHDAYYFSLLDATEGAEKFNEAFMKVNRDFSIPLAVADMMDEVIAKTGLNPDPKYVKAFRERATKMDKMKNEYLDQVVAVSQYTHNRGIYYPNGKPVMDTLEQMTDAFAEEVKRELGSSPVGMGAFVPTYTDTLHSGNAEAIFTAIDTMGAADPVQDTPEHKAHLAMIMNQLITKLIKPTKLLVQQMAPATVGRFEKKLDQPDEIKLAFGVITPASAVPQSRQEVFAHETVHAIEDTILEKGSKERTQIEWLHRIAGKYLTPLDLLPQGVQHTQNQIDAATAVFDYIFRNTNVQRIDTTNKANLGLSQARYKGDGFSEFLAYGLTNATVMGALHRLFDNKDAKAEWERGGEKLRRKTEQNSQIFTRMADAFTAMLDAFLAALNKYWNKVNGVENKPADEALLRLVLKLAGVENKAVTRTEKMYAVWNQGANSKAGQAIHDYVLAPLSKFMRSSNKRISRSVGGLIDKAGKSDAATLMGILRDTESLAQLSKDNFAVALTREMIGSTKDSRMFDALMRQSKHNIDSVQATITNSTRTLVRDKFSNQIDDTRSASITRGLLKTDASALWDGNANNLKELFADPSKLEGLIANLSNELKSLAPDYWQYLVNSSEQTGHFMSTGKPRYKGDTMYNASQITGLASLEAKANFDANAVLPVVDKLISAYAIQYTDSSDKANVVSVIAEELASDGKSPEVNGVQFLLDLYTGFKEQSLEQLFDNNPAHMMKGYVKETYNPNFGVSAMPEHEAMDYVRKGGTAFKLGKDNEYDPSIDQLYLVKSELLALETRVRGIISPTNLRAKGSDLFTSYLNAGHSVNTALQANDDVRNIKRKRRVANKKMNTANPPLAAENSLMPVWDTSGNVSGYRYMMSEKNKVELLERNDRFDDVIAHSRGSMVNKVNSAIINSNTVKGLKIDYDKHYRTKPNDFLAIQANSDDPELREMWFLMPEQMRAEINDEFGEDIVYVRKDYFRLVFGLRKANVAQMGEWFKEKAFNSHISVLLNQIGDMLQHKYAINTERVLKEIVSMAADTIVVKTGATLLGNVTSNMLILATEGIGLVYAARKQREAWVFMKKYQRDTVKLAKLTMELKSQALTSAERKSIQAEIASTQDNLAANKVTKMVDAGMFQSIIEDVSMLESGFEYAGKVEGFVQPYIDKVPPVLRDLGNVVFMTHKTSTYQFMRESTQLSDFVARYTMMEHLMEMGDITYEEAVAKTMDYFINYEVPTHKYLQYGNDVGLFMFTKFFFRIQKVIIKQLIDKPLNVLALIAGQKALGVDPSDIHDSAIFIGVNPVDKFNFNLATHLGTVVQPHTFNVTDGI